MMKRQSLDRLQLRCAQLYAKLASLPQDGLEMNQETLKLNGEVKKLLPWLSGPETIIAHLETLRQEFGMGPLPEEEKTKERLAWYADRLPYEALDVLRKHGCRLIVGLLDGEEVKTHHPEILRDQVWSLSKNGTVEVRTRTLDPRYELLFDLEQVIRRPPFPFRRCAVCRNVFVRIKRQQYCSRQCATKQAESTRSKEERRTYMRDYMAKRRIKQRKAGQAKRAA